MPEGNLKIGIQFVCGRIREACKKFIVFFFYQFLNLLILILILCIFLYKYIVKHSTTRCDAGKHLQELVDHFRHVKI